MANQKLKIATWNLNRPTLTTGPRNDLILEKLHEIDADILVLTETNSCIDLSKSYPSSFSTTCLFQSLSIGGEKYAEGENRVTIWSKLQGRRRIDVCNSHSAICAQLTTPWGELNVYGTVIGIYGKNRGSNEPVLTRTDFETALEVQLADWEILSQLGDLCIAGDFNLSLRNNENYYFTKRHRERLLESFDKLGIIVETKELHQNVDHIALSTHFLLPLRPAHESWPKDGSDHQGVWLTLEKA